MEWLGSPQEYGARKGATRPTEWQKTPGGPPGSARGGLVFAGNRHPRIEIVAQGDETPGVATEGYGVPWEDGLVKGGDGTPSITKQPRRAEPEAATRKLHTV